jgi:hypothetical protein
MGKRKAAKPAFLRDAEFYVAKWVPRLRLEDYLIEVKPAPDDFDSIAEARGNVTHLRAHVIIKDPAQIPEDDGPHACHDLEVTVVHELLHLRFGEVLLVLKGKAHYANEIATEMTAMALVAADRGVEPRSLYGL